jgi:hypothetical protein
VGKTLLLAARTAESITKFWADVPPRHPNFDGPAILMVEVGKDLGNSEWDKSDYEDNEPFTPSNQLNGIMATAWSGSSFANPGGDPGGTGVIGRGGANQGTGVQGLGGGIPDPLQGGAGGIGVHGIGGSQAELLEQGFLGPNVPPGAGIVGQGGRQPQSSNELRLPHGVVGLARGFSIPLAGVTDGVGVFGQGKLGVRGQDHSSALLAIPIALACKAKQAWARSFSELLQRAAGEECSRQIS